MDNNNFIILTGENNTSQYLGEIHRASDNHKDSLGFIPKGVFQEFIKRDEVYVLIKNSTENKHYAGHLVFNRRFPRAQIIQTFIKEEYRKRGFATKLIDNLCQSLTAEGFIFVYARVGDDLEEANTFWESNHFYVQEVKEGGTTKKRKILVRCRELESPQLFPKSGIHQSNPLGLNTTLANNKPLYLLDLNVLFDIRPRRLRRDQAASLFQAERMEFCRLAISNEVYEELRRTSYEGKTDPMEDYINLLPSFPLIQQEEVNELLEKLAHIVFPEKKVSNLSKNDISDIKHVATVIQHKLAGLITSDKSLLNAGKAVKAEYDIDILSPDIFIATSQNIEGMKAVEISDDSALYVNRIYGGDERKVRNLLLRVGLSGSEIATNWMPLKSNTPIINSLSAWYKEYLIGYVIWGKSPDNIHNVRIAIDEGHHLSYEASQALLSQSIEYIGKEGPKKIKISFPNPQSNLREVAIGLGFQKTDDSSCLIKVVLGSVVAEHNWKEKRRKLSEAFDIRLPDHIPDFHAPNQHLEIYTPDGNKRYVGLNILESLLSPCMFCLKGRPAVITPIQKAFSQILFEYSTQQSLLPSSKSSLFNSRNYLSSPRAFRHFGRGSIILFYESLRNGGQGAIIVMARVVEAYHKAIDSIGEEELGPSVLSNHSLTSIGTSIVKTVVVFDNIFIIPNPVKLSTLKQLGCGKPNDLISTKPITDSQFQSILTEAFKYGE